MKKGFFSLLTMGLLTLSPAGAGNIIPNPLVLTQAKGQFALTAGTSLVATSNEARSVAQYFAAKMSTSTGWPLTVVNNGKSNAIVLKLSSSIKGDEAYRLKVSTSGVIVEASTAKGLFYGMQSFLQLLPPQIEEPTAQKGIEWKANATDISDAPRFPYRGIMIDVCRHFLPFETLKKEIDALSMFKINTVHLHLTEDQGWRIEIKKYPQLTNVGAFRTEENGQRVGGFYTQEQIKELVKYAAERYITIVPELEIPGHELAAIAAIPSLSCRGQQITPRIIWGVEDVVMCPGKEETFKFLQDVIDEMVPLFPGKYFHIGGDECPRKEWEQCPLCQKRISDLGIKSEPNRSKEAQLQSYVVARIEKYLNSKGKSIIGWDEILEGGNLNKTATVMSWRGEAGGIEAARAGHDVIMTPGSHGMYLDHYQGEANVEPVAIGGNDPISKTYSYDPTPAVLVKEGKEKYVKGVQGNVWAEYIPDEEMFEYRAFPRILAVAEVGWTPVSRKNFTDFSRRLDSDASLRLKAHGINFHIPIPQQPGGSCSHLVFDDKLKLELTTTRPETIVFTLDGTLPSPQSSVYNGPIEITANSIVKTATLLPCGLLSPMRTIVANKTAAAPAINVATPSEGLTLKKVDGTFQSTSELRSTAAWETKTIDNIGDLRSQTIVPGNVRGVKNYAAIAEGYVRMPQTDIYTFSSNNAEVWIDGEKLIDNNADYVKRYSRNDAQINLSAGLHSIKVVFLGGIYDGWPTYWDDGSVSYRTSTTQWKAIDASMLYH